MFIKITWNKAYVSKLQFFRNVTILYIFFYLSVHFFILNLILQLHVLFLYSEVATGLHEISKINESAQMNTRLNYKTQVMYRGHCLWTLRNHLWLKFLHEVGLSHLVGREVWSEMQSRWEALGLRKSRGRPANCWCQPQHTVYFQHLTQEL